MTRMNLKPIAFSISLAIIFFVSSTFSENRTIDFQLHDTYFIISYKHIFQAISIFLLCQSLIYFVLKQSGKSIPNRTIYWQLGLFLFGALGILSTLCLMIQLQREFPKSFMFHVLIGLQIVSVVSFLASFIIFILAVLKSLFYK